MIDLSFSIIHASIFAGIFSTFVLSILFINPRIWLHDYPEKIKRIAPPKTEKEKKQSIVLSIIFIIIFVGYPIITIFLYKKPVTFIELFMHFFILFQFTNIIDLLILDWLIFCKITPKQIIIAGTAVEDGYKDYKFHFIAFLKGIAITTIAALVLSGSFKMLIF
jgi:DNA integrity scanning protein DisA with diadenylate cyclase activity